MRAVTALALVILMAVVPAGLGIEAAASTTPVFSVYQAPGGLGDGAGEPTLGVNPATGNVMYQSFLETLRVTFDDSTSPSTATWIDTAPIQNSINNFDPILFTDTVTGRTWAGGLDLACSVLAMTDDDGQTWTPVGNSCAPPSIDHETIASGPYRNNVLPTGATYPRAVYYCLHEVVEQCALSMDGGLTFGAPVPINAVGLITNPGCGGLFGHTRVAPNGIVYVPPRLCFNAAGDEAAAIIQSQNNGQTWLTRTVPGSDRAVDGFDPSVATTPSSWVYFTWEGLNGHPYASLTKTAGLSWSTPKDVSAGSGIETATFVKAIAGDDSRAAIAYLATTTPGNAFDDGFAGVWHLWVSYTFDSGATWTPIKVTTDPVQRGFICAGGVSCASGRNLLDFIDVQIDTQGNVLVAYADGCINNCALPSGTAAQSTSDKATIARQEDGPCLLAAKCGSASGTPLPAAFDDQCESSVVVFSSNSLHGFGTNPHAFMCITPGASGQDTAIINPGSDLIQIRFIQDLAPATLTARIDGLGLVDEAVTLVKGDGLYDSDAVFIDGSASGTLTVRVYSGATLLDSIVYHTVS